MENRSQYLVGPALTRRQREVYDFLRDHTHRFAHPPSLDELCEAMGTRSRGSMHKHVQALVDAGLVAPLDGRRRGVRLATADEPAEAVALPFLGRIAAGQPIEAIPDNVTADVPASMITGRPCFVLEVRGDSMMEDGILDGDRIVVESRSHADNGDVVVALIDNEAATLKRLEQRPGEVILHPANSALSSMSFEPERVRIQGVLVGLIRAYR
jgi:repressor LexA